MDRTRHISIAATVALLILMVDSGGHSAAANEPPVAEAGLPRYAAKDPVRLDGSGSYDPDNSGPLSYAWTQVSGPPLVITDTTSKVRRDWMTDSMVTIKMTGFSPGTIT